MGADPVPERDLRRRRTALGLPEYTLVQLFEGRRVFNDITAVVPAWGAQGAEHLAEALASLRENGVTSVLVVDNASDCFLNVPTDLSCLRLDHRVSLGEARNEGLRHVTTPWVLFWDADDRLPPGFLPRAFGVMAQRDDVVAVAGFLKEYETGRPYAFPPKWAPRLAQHRKIFALVNCIRLCYPVVGAVIKTEVARQAGGFATALHGEDWPFGISLAGRGGIVILPIVARLYRNSPRSRSGVTQSFGHIWERRNVARKRVRSDPGLPGWLRAVRPLIFAAQIVDAFMMRPLRARRKGRLATRSRGLLP